MFFDRIVSEKISKYGVGMIAGKGRYHFVASLGEADRVRQLCIATHCDLNGLPASAFKWFDNESHAVQVFRENKKACHKCLRSIETIELNAYGDNTLSD